MSQPAVNRRGVLKGALGIAGAAVGVAATATLLGAAPVAALSPGATPSLPPVPGMRGDRRANELWYQFDQVSYFAPSAEMKAAVGAIVAPFGGFSKLYDGYEACRQGGYPQSFLELIEPNRAAFEFVSQAQRQVFDTYYRHDLDGLTFAFQEFGQGTLFDPRRPVGNKVHMMNYTPPQPTHDYHAWQPVFAGFALLDIDRHYWRRVHPLVGIAWELQSIAWPAIDSPDNPHLPRHLVDHITDKWLRRDQDEIDAMFDVFPYPADMGK
ncbi:hypothetical protein ABH931_005309 [Streptacidiphilus sp. MAP12-33]|uniref:Tat pathway signal sequence domain protein n=1 Tax=Streptacidiphilus sp. MAP12-33 TaxID=3156266 RepID=UPI0035132EB4